MNNKPTNSTNSTNSNVGNSSNLDRAAQSGHLSRSAQIAQAAGTALSFATGGSVNVIALLGEILLEFPQYENMFRNIFAKVGGTGTDFDAARAEAFRLADALGHPAHYFTGVAQQGGPAINQPPVPIQPANTPYRTLYDNPIPSDADLIARYGFAAGDQKYAADEASPTGMWGVIAAGDAFGLPANTRSLGSISRDGLATYPISGQDSRSVAGGPFNAGAQAANDANVRAHTYPTPNTYPDPVEPKFEKPNG